MSQSTPALPDTPHAAILDRCVALAIDAGSAIMEVYQAPTIAASSKPDLSPVTEADTRAEAIILAGLRSHFPKIPIIAEEETAAGHTCETGDKFFLVDPLDGTREFISRNGDFTVNIALIENGAPTAGVVYAPVSGELFAGYGNKAYRAFVVAGQATDKRQVRCRPSAAPLTAVCSRSHCTPETMQWLDEHSLEDFVARGSSLKFCLLADGEADLYPRFGRTMEWDTAAGDAVLRAAGGAVVDLAGAPMIYNKRGRVDEQDFANGSFLALGDPRLIDRFARRA